MNAVMLLVLFAPIPIAKKAAPPPPAIKIGSYTMTWQGVDAQTIFHADGFYACLWHGRWWHGHWKQENGQLKVEEWPMDEPHRRSGWGVKLTGPMAGDQAGRAWKIVPQVFGKGGDA